MDSHQQTTALVTSGTDRAGEAVAASAYYRDLSLAIPTTSAADSSTFGRFGRLTLGIRHIE